MNLQGSHISLRGHSVCFNVRIFPGFLLIVMLILSSWMQSVKIQEKRKIPVGAMSLWQCGFSSLVMMMDVRSLKVIHISFSEHMLRPSPFPYEPKVKKKTKNPSIKYHLFELIREGHQGQTQLQFTVEVLTEFLADGFFIRLHCFPYELDVSEES